MLGRRSSFKVSWWTLAIMVVPMLVAVAYASEAPTGTYTAYMGASAAAGGGRVTGVGAGGGAATGGAAAVGTKVTMNINRYITSDDLAALKANKGNPSGFVQTLTGMNSGSVNIGGQTFTVNAAHSVQTGSKYHVFLLGARPFAFEAQNTPHSAQGGAVGYIRLTVDSGGKGNGALYTATAVTFQKNGQIKAGAAAATATKLNDVSR